MTYSILGVCERESVLVSQIKRMRERDKKLERERIDEQKLNCIS